MQENKLNQQLTKSTLGAMGSNRLSNCICTCWHIPLVNGILCEVCRESIINFPDEYSKLYHDALTVTATSTSPYSILNGTPIYTKEKPPEIVHAWIATTPYYQYVVLKYMDSPYITEITPLYSMSMSNAENYFNNSRDGVNFYSIFDKRKILELIGTHRHIQWGDVKLDRFHEDEWRRANSLEVY